MGSTKVSDEMLSRTLASVPPITLPMQAFGRQPVEWFATMGANDRVVVLEVPCDGGHWQPVVWRNAVTVRSS